MLRSALFIGALLAAPAFAEPVRLASPDGRVEIVLEAAAGGARPAYSVNRDGAVLIAPSALGLNIVGVGELGRHYAIATVETRSGRERYRLFGRVANVDVAYNEATVTFVHAEGRRFAIVLRAQNDGVAFRYIVPANADAPIEVAAESTQFALDPNITCWGLNLGRFDSSHEGEFDPMAAAAFRPMQAFDAPLVCETAPGGSAFALTDADIGSYPALYLSGRGDGGPGVEARLAPRPDAPHLIARARIGEDLLTPWRVIMVGDHAGRMIESTLVTDLSAPAAFDASWVRPGQSAWDWWNGGRIAAVPDSGMNTATFRALIDFAAANGMRYVTIDEGWSRGAGGLAWVVRPGTDITQSIEAIDIPALVAYGRARGVGVLLWVHWRALDAQMEEAFTTYRRWGVAGVKVDFMDRDDQAMVDWQRRLLARAGEYRLLVNLHGAFHPVGLVRTFPNYLTQEGVLGAEYNKWSRRITARHNVTLAYTRLIIGPMDYTPGGFRHQRPEDFEISFILPNVMTTRAHGLAMFVVYESPLTTVADTPDAYAGAAEARFIAGAPTVWDETRFLGGEIGEWVAVARRSGWEWRIGVMNNESARQVALPLSFLGRSRFDATIYADGDAPDRTRISTRRLSGADVLTLDLAASGGAAISLVPR